MIYNPLFATRYVLLYKFIEILFLTFSVMLFQTAVVFIIRKQMISESHPTVSENMIKMKRMMISIILLGGICCELLLRIWEIKERDACNKELEFAMWHANTDSLCSG